MLPWGGITCCLSAAVLYLLGRRSGRHAEALNSATRVNKLVDLAQLLDAASKLLPLVVAVTGRVGSDSPVNCKCSGLRGVIVEETEEEHLLKHSDAGSWIEDSALVSYRRQEASWYLDDGTDRVYVVGARGAKGLVLTTGSEVFEESGKSGHSLMLGVKRIERVLPTGTSLTVVGEAIRDDTGTIQIQQPHRGPIYVSHKTIDELIASLGKWARCYKYSSVGFTIFGVYLLSKHVFHHIIERRRHWEVRKRIHKAAARRQDNEGSDGKTGNDSDSTKKDRSIPDLCVICLEQEYNSVFVPCGHMCCCTACSSHLTNCPLCRRRIEQVVKTFRH